MSAVAAYRLSTKLGRLRHPRATAARLIALGAVGAAAQTADAVTRHYWPLAVVAALCSRRARGTVAAVALGSGVLDWWRAGPERPALPAFLLARRLDDLAYGAGLWWGAAHTPHARPVAARSDPPRGLLRKTESTGGRAPLLRRSTAHRSAIADPFPVRVETA